MIKHISSLQRTEKRTGNDRSRPLITGLKEGGGGGTVREKGEKKWGDVGLISLKEC